MSKKRKLEVEVADQMPVEQVFPGDPVAEPEVDFPEGSQDEVDSVPDRAREAIEGIVLEAENESASAGPGEAVLSQGSTLADQTQGSINSQTVPQTAQGVSADPGTASWTAIIVKQPWGYDFKKVSRMTRSEALNLVRKNEWNRAGGAIIIQGERIM